MLDSAQIKQLKQTNISADGEKTGARVRQAWKNANSADRREITTLADIAVATVRRCYTTGSISAKMAVTLAQVLKIDPFYLTAETDDVESAFDEDMLNAFLTAHGYEELIQAPKARRKRAVKAVPAEPDAAATSETEAAPEMEIEIEPIIFVEMTPAPEVYAELSDDDVIILLRALRLKAACGAEGAVDALKKLYGILLG